MSLMKSVLLNFSYVLLLLNNGIIQAEAFDYCSSDVGCPGSQYCCDRNYPEDNVCRYNCLGESCILDSDCATGEYCCDANDKCSSNCLGKSCTWNSDCPTDECCDSNDKCSSDCTGLAGGIIAAIVIGVIITIAIPVSIVACCCCCGVAAASRRPVQRGVIVTQQPAAGMTVVASHSTQGQAQYYPPTAVQPNPYYNNFNKGQVGPPPSPYNPA